MIHGRRGVGEGTWKEKSQVSTQAFAALRTYISPPYGCARARARTHTHTNTRAHTHTIATHTCSAFTRRHTRSLRAAAGGRCFPSIARYANIARAPSRRTVFPGVAARALAVSGGRLVLARLGSAPAIRLVLRGVCQRYFIVGIGLIGAHRGSFGSPDRGRM